MKKSGIERWVLEEKKTGKDEERIKGRKGKKESKKNETQLEGNVLQVQEGI